MGLYGNGGPIYSGPLNPTSQIGSGLYIGMGNSGAADGQDPNTSPNVVQNNNGLPGTGMSVVNPYVAGGIVPTAPWTPANTNTAGGSLVPGLGGIGNPTGMNNTPGGVMNPMPPTAIEGGVPKSTPVQSGVSDTSLGTGSVLTPTTVPGTSVPAGGNSAITGANVGSLLGTNNPAIEGQLNNLYGNGIGTALYQYLSGGAGYNPAVAQALLAQNQPLEAQGRANVLESFGATGNRDSSSAALGLSNFESNFELGQTGQLANLYQNSVNNYQNLFGGVVNTAQLAEANKPTTLDTLGQIAGLLGGTGSGGGILGALGKLFGKGGLLSGGKADPNPASGQKGAGNNNNNTSAIPKAVGGPSLNGAPSMPMDPSTAALLEGLGISPDAWQAAMDGSQAGGGTSDSSINNGIGDIIDLFGGYSPAIPNLGGYGGDTSVSGMNGVDNSPQTTTSDVPDYIDFGGDF